MIVAEEWVADLREIGRAPSAWAESDHDIVHESAGFVRFCPAERIEGVLP